MVQHQDSETAGTLDELATLSDRVAEWIQMHPAAVLFGVALILIIAAGFGGYRAWKGGQEERVAAELAATLRAYRTAMGADSDALEIPEPANPETAQRAREQYRDRLSKLAAQHIGTRGGTMARIEAGQLAYELDEAREAIGIWETAAAELPPDSALRGVVLERIAMAYEKLGNWSEAARNHEVAAEIETFPMRHWAQVEAARCYAEAGEWETAEARYRALREAVPELEFPPYLSAVFEETRREVPSEHSAVESESASDPAATPTQP